MLAREDKPSDRPLTPTGRAGFPSRSIYKLQSWLHRPHPTSPSTVPIAHTGLSSATPYQRFAHPAPTAFALVPYRSLTSPTALILLQCLLRLHYLHGLHSILRPYLGALNVCPNLSALMPSPHPPPPLRPHVKLTTPIPVCLVRCPTHPPLVRVPLRPTAPIAPTLRRHRLHSSAIVPTCAPRLNSPAFA